MTVSLAISPCPNDTFIFHAWVHGLVPGAPPVEVTYADVDVTNGLAEAGRLDVLKISYAALPWVLDEYALLPAGGALGRGCGPLVLVASPPAGGRLDGARVAVPGERTTAYLLFRLWAADHDLAGVEVMPFEQIMPAVREGRVDAGLVIHEARFTYQRFGLTRLVDLGEWWEEQTGLAIPLGAIVARRGLDVAAVADAIRGSLRRAWANPAASRDYVLEHAQEMEPDVVDAHIGLYVTEHSLALGVDGLAAVRGLLTRAEAAGLVPAIRPGALDPVG
ncbi:MAG TPA: 1,4-dihydroxy-6-naphthoate synthase [Mycobacteriales bacterium]|nr:1,4-dihydroxy-6-naphthoate synthase [Mycobacteriales bacterium]